MWEWCFTVFRLGKPAYTNVMYYWALNCASSIAHEIGETDVSIGFVSRAFRLGEAIERALFDEGKGAFVDTTADRGRVPQDANALAIVAGLSGDPQTSRRILDYMRDHLWVDWGSTNVDVPYYRLTPGLQPHNKRVVPFMNNYEVLARFAAHDDAGALELLRRCWGGMVVTEPGTTFWEWSGKNGGGGRAPHFAVPRLVGRRSAAPLQVRARPPAFGAGLQELRVRPQAVRAGLGRRPRSRAGRLHRSAHRKEERRRLRQVLSRAERHDQLGLAPIRNGRACHIGGLMP